jgi:hypothetical protein
MMAPMRSQSTVAVVTVTGQSVGSRGRQLAEGGARKETVVKLVRVEFPHRIPITLGWGRRSPQKSHGQNGLIRHAAARLLAWLHQP